MSKTLEKIVARLLNEFLHGSNLSEEFQSGYRDNRSIEAVLLLNVSNDLLMASGQHSSVLVLPDLCGI